MHKNIDKQKERAVLLQKLADSGSDLTVDQLSEVSNQGLQDLIEIREAVKEPKEELLNQLEQLGVDNIDLYENEDNSFLKMQILRLKRVKQYEEEFAARVYASELKELNNDQETSFSSDLAQYMSLKDTSEPFQSDSEFLKLRENRLILAENRIREKVGLPLKKLRLLESDLQAILSIGAEEEFLESVQDKFLRSQYKKDFEHIKSMQALNDQRERRQKKEEQEIANLNLLFQDLKKRLPKKLIPSPVKGEEGTWTLSPDFSAWSREWLKLVDKVRHKVMVLEKAKREEVDKRSHPLFKLNRQIEQFNEQKLN